MFNTPPLLELFAHRRTTPTPATGATGRHGATEPKFITGRPGFKQCVACSWCVGVINDFTRRA
eukprot:8130548-Prorocentrum_lima.AAC.1